ncbi:MAG: hypothetical protein N3D81_06915, partial [Spirochaetes bacterium]|nr:hypothetical protein [Spirochaetota bacterium]
VRAVYEVSDATGNLNDRFSEVYGVMRGAVEVLRSASERLPEVVESLKVLGEELDKFKVKEVKLTKGITLVD